MGKSQWVNLQMADYVIGSPGTLLIQDKAQYHVASSDGIDSPSMEPVLRKMKLLSLCYPSGEERGFRTQELGRD